MNRKEFLEQLERLLWDIPEQERAEALDYYRNYFEDAGEENESGVIQELGSPGKVAAMILADLEEEQEEHGEYTETGYTDERFDDRDMPDTAYASEEHKKKNNWDGTKYQKTEESQGYDGPYRRAGFGRGRRIEKKKRSPWLWVLILLFVLLALPVVGGIGIGFLGAAVGIVAAVIGVVIALLLGGLAMLVGSVAAMVYAVFYQAAAPASALVTVGAALLAAAAGLLLILVFLWLVFKAFPMCFRWIVDFIQRILHRGRKGGGRV